MSFVQPLDDEDVCKDFTPETLDEIRINRLRLKKRKNAAKEKNSEAKNVILQGRRYCCICTTRVLIQKTINMVVNYSKKRKPHRS